MQENVIQIKSGITINVDASVKNIIYMKNIIFGILLHVVVKGEGGGGGVQKMYILKRG